MIHHRHLNTASKRAALSAILIFIVMAFGAAGMHTLEGMSYLDAFYFMSMIATAQGSAYTPASVGGKLFAAFMSFVAVGACVTALGFLFGPLLGKLWHLGAVKYKEETEGTKPNKKS